MTKKGWLVLVGCLILVLGLGVTGTVLFFQKNKPKPVAEDSGVKLYWNIDRNEYVGDSTAGMNSRERGADGYYTVRFAVDGGQVEYKVKKARLLQKIDTLDIMGLAINEEGVITKVYDPENITGGEIASLYYVVMGTDETVTICEDEYLSGDYETLILTEDVGIYNVTGMDPVGYADNVATCDQIRAFQNEDGEVTHIFIVNRYGYWAGESVEAYCEHCEETVDWYVWEDKYSLPKASGHWILKNDAKLSSQTKITAQVSIILDLNGHTVTGADSKRVYAMTGEKAFLAILDSSKEGTGTIIGRGAPENGGIVYVRYGTFELYSGTLNASAIKTTAYATAVRIQAGCTFNMYDGEIIGGTAIGSMNDAETSTTGGFGGTIQVSGTFNMYDGVIRDGIVLRYEKKDGTYTCGNGGNLHLGTNSVFNMYGGSILNGKAESKGGNIYTGSNVVVNISGGTISGGAAIGKSSYGGNIYINSNSQALNIYDGVIKDGSAWGAGGNIALFATMNMSGGTITGGSSLKGSSYEEAVRNEDYPHHNMYCASGGVFNMSGGLIEGYVRIRDSETKKCTVYLTGTAQIKGGSINLSLDAGDDVNIGTFEKGAAIYINGGGYVSTETAKANAAYVHSSYAGVETEYINKKIFIGKHSCVCGHTDGTHIGDCDGTVLDWIPWGTASSMPAQEANWYLVTDVDTASQVKIDAEATFRLDLNGHSVTCAENIRVYALKNGKINMVITDLSEKKDGAISVKGDKQGRGACIWVSENSILTVYGGILDGSKAGGLYGGTTLTVDEGSKVVMYDGTIIGGRALYLRTEKDGKETTSNGFGGAAAVYGTFEMYGGKITGGYSEGNGGNVYVTTNGSFLLAGGEVTGGYSEKYGGNFYVNGILTIADGATTEGHARQGGNVYIKSATGDHVPVFVMSGGSIIDGVAGNATNPGTGGNIASLGAFTMTGGTISGGVVLGKEDQTGANIYMKPGADGSTFTMTGGLIAGLARANYEGTLTIGGTARITNDKGDTNLTLASNATIVINGLKEGALIGVNPQYDTYFASGATSSDLQYFAPDIDYRKIELTDGDKLTIVADWEPWTDATSLPSASGKYYLTCDVTVSVATALENCTILLNLNGYKIETATDVDVIPRVYVLKAKSSLSIYDYSEKGTGKIVSHRQYTASAGVFELREKGAVLNLYGGTIDASNVKLLSYQKTTTNKDGTPKVTTTNYYGAAVYVNSGTEFNMYGGSIVGGQAYRGGSVYVNLNAVFNMEGGIIANGTAAQGGNVYLAADTANDTAGGTMNMSDGSITGGTVTSTGGNVLALGKFIMTGGTISGGVITDTEDQLAANVYTKPGASGCTFTMTGGLIAGLVKVNNAGMVTIGGTAQITNDNGDTNLWLKSGAKIVISGLQTGAKIGVSPQDDTYFAMGAVKTDVQYFTADKTGNTIEFTDDDKLMVAAIYESWTSTDSLPTAAGKYRLMNDITLTAAYATSDVTITIDLNGYRITAASKKRAMQVNSSSVLNIEDKSSAGTGMIVGNGSASEGGVILVYGGSTLNLYGGTVDASANYCTGTGGGAISVRENSFLNMYGGKIAGGSIKSGKSTVYGGNVIVRTGATFNMYGGEITGGTASGSNGGNVYVQKGAAFTMSGGKITGGKAAQGGNVYIQADSDSPAVFNMEGGSIIDGETTSVGGNVAALGVFTMTGGTVSGGQSTNSASATSGNVYTKPGADGCSFTMSGGTIAGLVKVNTAGTITLSKTAKITTGTYTGSSSEAVIYGLHLAKEYVTIAIGADGLETDAEIWLNTNDSASGTRLANGSIAASYQSYFHASGIGSLEFRTDGIYVK